MKLTSDFFNKLASEIDKTYFPEVIYYRDNERCTSVHFTIERFNNGCLTYSKFIDVLAKNCNETKDVINTIVSKYVVDFEGYKYV